MDLILTVMALTCIILQYLIILDIILSWLLLVQIEIRPQFLANILDPLYLLIRNKIPTTLWPIDFTAIIIIIVLSFLVWFITSFSTQALNQVQKFESIF